MTRPRPTRRRSSTARQTTAADLARVTAARDELDAVAAEQRREEDSLIAEYLSATKEAADIIARRDTEVAHLDHQLRELLTASQQALAATDECRAAALAGLNKHRSAEKLGILFDLPPKRIRKFLHAHRKRGAPAGSAGRALNKVDKACTVGAAAVQPAVPTSTSQDDPTAVPERDAESTPLTSAESGPTPPSDHPAADDGQPARSFEPDVRPPLANPERLF